MTVKVEAAEQPIAIQLFRADRYIIVGDPTIYEKGVVYEVAPEYAKRLLSLNDGDFPVFIHERPAKTKMVEVPVEDRAPARREVRAPKNKAVAAAPVQETNPQVQAVRRVDIQDDDPALAERLRRLDAEGDGDAVRV